ncbi:acetylserotonin O-methyltransferase [Actinokineospora globicatena]|uniref:acetylserotonin O-methyltransferase n=1 Tax=Actinokineospora globicatena TaxID=103729 RepID=UPI0020A2CB6D|nr:acetylserotonin O-methyltransferase [Actinokineospora globicatena]MCP2306763.1 O-methyltransferase [Actinokineospora globicatena]GLW82118.1 phenazine-specific methyltransferase [Actinokineospora globicatena]GLW88911.1 phenazine-specific methyltransferase [Actinokineospora globicatena]
MTTVDPARAVVDVITGTWRTQALYAAVKLRLPDHIAAGCGTGERLAAAAEVGPDAVVRLMRLLTAIGVFGGDDTTGYTLTPVSDLLRDGVPGSMRDMCLLYGEEFHEAWGATVPALRTGRSGFEDAFGRTLHQYLADEPDAGPRFLRAMNAGGSFFAEVANGHDFGTGTVVDVAGGSGMLLSSILLAHQGAHGVLFDREHMVQVAKEHLTTTVAGDRFDVVSGDFFESVPTGADTYVLSRILQDWDDRRCVDLLTTVRRAMRAESARLLVVERVVDEDGARLLPLLFDLHLMVMAGGRERTMAGYRSLLAAAGLRLESVRDLALETSLLVARPV